MGEKLKKELKLAIAAARDKKAMDLVILDLRNISNFTDFFFICHGTSVKQTQAICDAIEEKLAKSNFKCNHSEGFQLGDWILMDYFDFIIHIFTEEKRAFFNLERLWGDAKKMPIPPERKKSLLSKKSKVSKTEKTSSS